jgi:signal transduction histidine kinase
VSVRAKLVAIILFVALAPLGISAFTALRVHQRAYDEKLDELQRATAAHGAKLAEKWLDDAARGFKLLAGQVEWPTLTDEERSGALELVYRQHDDVVVASLLDERGAGVGASAFAERDEPGHRAPTPPLLEAFARAIPFEAAQHGSAVGAPFVVDGVATVPLGLAVDGGGGKRWVVAVALQLGGLCREPAPADGALAHLPDGHAANYRATDGREMRAAAQAMPIGWRVVARQPAEVAFASSRQIRAQALGWFLVSLVVALGAGLFLARGIDKPVQALVHGAGELGAGRFGHRIAVDGEDEFARLSRAFNQMGEEIEKRDAAIRAWNADLQRRVEERTRELREAEEQLLTSQKMAAITALGAGFAHEINNPLTSVIAMTQVMLRRARRAAGPRGTEEVEMLATVEAEALRIKKTVGTLLSLTQDQAGDAVEIDCNLLLDDAVAELGNDLDARIELDQDYAEGLPLVLGSVGELREALVRILRNAVTAMPKGGRLTLSTASIDGHAVRIAVRDSGVGIAAEHLGKVFDPFFTTKENWRGEGLGLTVAHRVVQQHQGKIQVASAVGAGTTVTITLPAASGGAHLR